MRPLVVLVIPLAACLPELPGDGTGSLAADRDHDGTPDGEDCAPDDPSVHPGAEEACNTQDDDCDGATDEGVLTDYYADVDGDGYGDAANVVPACGPSDGWVLDATDCDDAHADASPAGVEVCDGLDNDCAGGVDDGVGEEWYADGDGDGYGDPSTAIRSCSEVDGYVVDATDCDDSDPSVHPPSRECHPAGTYGLAEADYKLVGAAGGDYAGPVAFAGDLDGDGYGDVVVSAGLAGTNGVWLRHCAPHPPECRYDLCC